MSLSENCQFAVSSFYRKLTWHNVTFPHKFLWKIIIPLKIGILLGLVVHESILNKDVLNVKVGRVILGVNFVDRRTRWTTCLPRALQGETKKVVMVVT